MENHSEICQLLADIKSELVSAKNYEIIAHKDLLTKQEAALFMGVSKSYIDKMVKGRLVPYSSDHIGANTIWLNKKDLISFMKKETVLSISDIKSDAASELRKRNIR